MQYSIFIFCILVAVVCGTGNNGLCDEKKGSTKTDSLKPVCSKYARFDNDGLNATEACSMALAYVTCVHEITAMTCGAEFANKALKGPHDNLIVDPSIPECRLFIDYLRVGGSVEEVTPFSILSKTLAENKSLPILQTYTLSTLEQKMTKGENRAMVLQLFKHVNDYENGIIQGNLEYRELPLLPAVESNGKGAVGLVDNPFYSPNCTLSDIHYMPVVRDPPISIPRIKQFSEINMTTDTRHKLIQLLSALASEYGNGLGQKVQLVPLVLSGRVTDSLVTVRRWVTVRQLGFELNAGVAVVLPEEDGYRALGTMILHLKSKGIAPRKPGMAELDYFNDI